MAEALKDTLFTPVFFERMCRSLTEVYPIFDTQNYLSLVYDGGWDTLELKARMRHAAVCLGKALPSDYAGAIGILLRLQPTDRGFEYLLFADFVEVFGTDNFELSLDALELFTQWGSAEFAIRPFIIREPERTMSRMLQWATHPNEHVRRLASEGCRPRLPWAQSLPNFKLDPAPILPVLELLKADPSEYVRKSVANNLNDISKDHPELVLDLAKAWLGHQAQTDWIVKHALRSLLKAGNKTALQLFNYGQPNDISVIDFCLSHNKVHLGMEIRLKLIAQNATATAAKTRLEFGVYYLKSNGTHNRKVFQLAQKLFEPGATLEFHKTISFTPKTTRKFYTGQHKVALIVNGAEVAERHFEVLA